jgi:hypothetical protein
MLVGLNLAFIPEVNRNGFLQQMLYFHYPPTSLLFRPPCPVPQTGSSG